MHYGSKNGPTKIAQGHTKHVKGKEAQISINKAIDETARILSVVTIGKDDPTAAEKERENIILEVLQKRASLFDQPIVQRIFSSSLPAHTHNCSPSDKEIYISCRRLNDSQLEQCIASYPSANETRCFWCKALQGPAKPRPLLRQLCD